VKPLLHVFGHIHETHGVQRVQWDKYHSPVASQDERGRNLPKEDRLGRVKKFFTMGQQREEEAMDIDAGSGSGSRGSQRGFGNMPAEDAMDVDGENESGSQLWQCGFGDIPAQDKSVRGINWVDVSGSGDNAQGEEFQGLQRVNCGGPLRAGEETLFVNAAIMTLNYRPRNSPWVVDIDLPAKQ
jgi:hypothetical protein